MDKDKKPATSGIFSSTELQKQITSTPLHFVYEFRDLPESSIHASYFDSLPSYSRSQTSLKDECDKENDASFFVQYSPAGDRGGIRRKKAVPDDIHNEKAGVLMQFSPGTKASQETMRKRLESMGMRNELRKAKIKKAGSSQGRLDLRATEESFLNSVDAVNLTIGREGIKIHDANIDNSSLLHSTISTTSDISRPTNATYVIQPKLSKNKPARTDLTPVVRHFTKEAMNEDKRATHVAALTSWLNYLLDEKDTDSDNEMQAKNKKDADRFLMKILKSGGDIPSRTCDEPPKNIGYKAFMATIKLNEMRSRFQALYSRSSFPRVISNAVKNGRIAIRRDRQIYADIGLQTEMLDLLLCFHSFYLRLGLETVLSTTIEMRTSSRGSIAMLAAVVSQNLFRDPKIMNNRKYVQGRTKMLINERGTEVLRQHFLTKMLQFLFIVGEAWRDDIISRKNRCLFVKWSPYKSINDVMAALSRELLSGASGAKILSQLGLVSNQKQGFFEEFQYHVNDLLKDLSNGLILGRAVEILGNMEYNAVIRCLRNPAGDRLRKVGNVKSVISFAKRNGILPEDVKVNADNIVRGDPDEIISLLWRFVGIQLSFANESDDQGHGMQSICKQLESLFGLKCKIQNPLELADGNLFAELWRRYYAYGTPFQLFDGMTVMEQIANAAEFHFGIPSSLMLNWKHGCDERTLCVFATIYISRIYECHRFACAAVTIQRAYRRYRKRKIALSELREAGRSQASTDVGPSKVEYEVPAGVSDFDQDHSVDPSIQLFSQTVHEERVKAAVTIQKFVRGWLVRICYRRMLNEKYAQKREKAAVILQRHIRAWLARKRYRKMQDEKALKERENAACILQSYIRGWLARIQYRNLQREAALREQENAAITLQRYARGLIARSLYRNMQRTAALLKQENAATTLQRYARGWKARALYRNMQQTAALLKQENAAVTLQRYVRGWLARAHYREMRREMALRERESAAVTLQNTTPATEQLIETANKTGTPESNCNEKAERLRQLRELKRKHDRLRKERDRFIRAVQEKFRYALLLKAMKDKRIRAATIIQAWWRGNLHRKRTETICKKLTERRIVRQEALLDDERAERMRPIMDRVMSAMENLNSERLFIRFKATEVLHKFVGLSELCARYVVDNGGLECILDSLDGCNRSVGSTVVVTALCSILQKVLKFKTVRSTLSNQRQQDIVKQCYHYMLAFYKVPNVIVDLSKVIVTLGGSREQYEKAPFFVAELTKKFAKLPESDERVVALRELQAALKI